MPGPGGLPALEQRFGVTRDFVLAHVDWFAAVGEPAVSTLLDRADELAEAVAPRWFPGATERPGEIWVVLYRADRRDRTQQRLVHTTPRLDSTITKLSRSGSDVPSATRTSALTLMFRFSPHGTHWISAASGR